jgi:hypothetical protein
MRLASMPGVMRRMAAMAAIAFVVAGATTAGAQGRFDAVEQNAIDGVPGLQVITIRDTMLKTLLRGVCPRGRIAYQRASPSGTARHRAGEGRTRCSPRPTAARVRAGARRDSGNDHSNPLRYDWQAEATEMEFMLFALEQQFARLQQELDRIAAASQMAMSATPVRARFRTVACRHERHHLEGVYIVVIPNSDRTALG